ncbi:MAG: carboxypeptidase regulatory-like domain-containing protein, partial [Armatimonadetes bacterium]|nr:carboxypeptidase regulatory-like domain-containing protein [Armatimonadota bacterium]
MLQPHRSTTHTTVLAVTAIVALYVPCAGTQTWDIASGFSPTSNPNGVWTYGYQSPLGGALNTFATKIVSNGVDTWCKDNYPDAAGNVTKNRTGAPSDWGGMWWGTNGMAMHPGLSNQKATVRWSAPSAMLINVNVTFSGANYATGTTTDVHILHNGSSFFDDQINGFGGGGSHAASGSSPSQTCNAILYVAQGDSVDFAVGYGGNGFNCDLTAISGAITSITDSGLVKGIVTSNASGHPILAGATVRTSDSSVSTLTASDGSYQLILPSGTLTIEASYPGTISQIATIDVVAGQIKTQDFDLGVGAGESWNIADGFSSTSNPNGVWSYGYKSSLGGALVQFTSEIVNSGIDTWCINNNPDISGNVTKNGTGAPSDWSGMWWNTNGMAMHPGPNNQIATIRWTAPSAIVAEVDVTFSGANYGMGTTTDVHVLHNGSSVFDGQINGFGGGGSHAVFGTSPSRTYDGLFYVAQGDTIDFALGYGGNGFTNDLTAISGAITTITDRGVVRGTVTANVPGHPVLASATVKTSGSSVSTVTDSNGSYEFILPAGAYTIEAGYPGTISDVAAVEVVAEQIEVRNFDLTPGVGHTYYVSPDGVDTANGTSPESAWKTISHGDAAGVLRAGDTVIVTAGVYKPADFNGVHLTRCSGTAEKPIIYKAQGSVMIDQSTTPRASDGVSYGFLVQADGIVIDGFGIVGCQWGLYFQNGHSDNTAINNVIHGMRVGQPSQTGLPGWCGGICNSEGTNRTNRNNLIYDIGDPTISNIAACIASSVSVNTKITNNTLVGGRCGVQVWSGGSGLTVKNNIIADMRLEGISAGCAEVFGFQHSHNLFNGNAADYGAGVSVGANETTGNPLFIDIVNHDYHLDASSPAIDAGADLGFPFYGAAPDLGAFELAPEVVVTQLGALKTQPDGVGVAVTSPKVVTISSGTLADGSYYVEDSNRASGVRLLPAPGLPPVSIGDRITFSGTVITDENGEKVVNITSIQSKDAGADIRPLGMSNKAAATGLVPSALLAKVWGWVTYRGSDYIYVDDGSGVRDASGRTGVRVFTGDRAIPMSLPAVNHFAFITGIAGSVREGNTVVRTVRPRTSTDVEISTATPNESAIVAQWMASNLGPSVPGRPFSFTYGGASSSDLLPTWQQDYATEALDGQRTQFTITYTDPATGLRVKCVGIQYHDFPTVEWTLYFKNTGSGDTPILENIQSLDCVLDRGTNGEFTLHHNVGSPCTPTDYKPLETVMGPYSTLEIGGAGGRPTNSDLPYFNLENPDGGVIIVIGWPGQWSASFARDAG